MPSLDSCPPITQVCVAQPPGLIVHSIPGVILSTKNVFGLVLSIFLPCFMRFSMVLALTPAMVSVVARNVVQIVATMVFTVAFIMVFTVAFGMVFIMMFILVLLVMGMIPNDI